MSKRRNNASPEGFVRGQRIGRHQLREGMIVAPPEFVLEDDGKTVKDLGDVWPDAPSQLVVDVWDLEQGDSYLVDATTWGTDDEVGIDYNVLDYPDEFVYLGEVEPGSGRRLDPGVADALAKINRYRAQIGERPLAPAQAGWTDEDILLELRRIESNPRCGRSGHERRNPTRARESYLLNPLGGPSRYTRAKIRS